MPRNDGIRNRAKILATARTAVGERGLDVAMVDLARSAGVAVGTLYNHFPTKADLLAAVLAEYVADVADVAEDLHSRVQEGDLRPADALRRFLKFAVDASAINHAVKAAAAAAGSVEVGNATDEARAAQALTSVILAGQRSGEIRGGLTTRDIYLMVHSAPVDSPARQRDRWVELVGHGLTLSQDD